MKTPVNYSTVEEDILLLQQKSKNSSISIDEILQTLSGKGQALILLLLSLPFCQPLQIPGLSTPFGLTIAFIGLQMIFGKYAWLPKIISTKTIASHNLQTITDKILWLLKKINRWVHPRLSLLCHHPAWQIINGLFIFVLGLLLALPMPIPFSNLLAAWSLFFMGVGLLKDDGVFVLISYFIALFTCAFFVATVLLIKIHF